MGDDALKMALNEAMTGRFLHQLPSPPRKRNTLFQRQDLYQCALPSDRRQELVMASFIIRGPERALNMLLYFCNGLQHKDHQSICIFSMCHESWLNILRFGQQMWTWDVRQLQDWRASNMASGVHGWVKPLLHVQIYKAQCWVITLKHHNCG